PWLQAREHHLNWTPAQRAVAQHVAQGLTTKQIARALGKSDQTVKEQLSSMMQKAGVRTRTALAIRLVAEQHRVSE
ncbi:MAG: response regulator transcription factor, partial [Alcaligenaceae bacterium]